MKIRDIIDCDKVIWFSLISVPIHIIATLFTTKSESYIIGGAKLIGLLYDCIVFMLFLIFVYGLMMKKLQGKQLDTKKMKTRKKKFRG